VESEGRASRDDAAHISTVMWPRCVGSCREAEAQARSRSSSWTGVSRAARRTVHRSGSAVSWTRHIMPRSGARAAPASPREETARLSLKNAPWADGVGPLRPAAGRHVL